MGDMALYPSHVSLTVTSVIQKVVFKSTKWKQKCLNITLYHSILYFPLSKQKTGSFPAYNDVENKFAFPVPNAKCFLLF